MAGIATGTISVVLPAISDAFGDGTNAVQIKSVVTATGLGMMIGAPLGGFAADRLGRRSTLLIACVTYGFAGCGIIAMESLWQIILGRFIVGLAAGTLGVGLATVISEHFDPKEQSRWIGGTAAVATFFVLGAVPAAGALADIGWRYSFVIYSVSAPIFFMILLGIPRRDLARASREVFSDISVSKPTISISAIVLAVFVGTLQTGASLYWPFRLRDLGADSARDIALFALPNFLLVGVGALSYGFVRRTVSVRSVFLHTAILSCLGLSIVSLASAPWAVMIGLAIEGFAIGMITPNLTVYALAVSPPAWRGRSVGIVKGTVFGSPFLTQFLLEPLNQYGGSAAALAGVAIMSAGLAAAVWTNRLGQVQAQRAEK